MPKAIAINSVVQLCFAYIFFYKKRANLVLFQGLK